MSNFKNVVKLNRVYGANTTDSQNLDWNPIEFQADLIKEELDELMEAVKNKDYQEVKDAIGDILVTAYGMGYVASFDCDKLMDNIDQSNMSKVHYSMEDAKKSQEYYKNLGVPSFIVDVEYANRKYYILKSDATIIGSDHKVYKKNKVLKGMNFYAPSLDVDVKKGSW